MPKRKLPEPLPDVLREQRKSAFGVALRGIRLDKSITQEQLAWATGISPIFISNLERGLKEPCLNTIATLCEALSVPISDLMLSYEKALRRLQRQQRQS